MNIDTLVPVDDIAAELLRRGLPVDYARRAAAEFADHHSDLTDELSADGGDEKSNQAEASRRLGEARVLVNKTVREYQRRYWCGRWPLVTFLLGPIPLLISAWIASIAAASGAIWLLHQMGIVGDFQQDGIVTTHEWLVDRAVTVWFFFAAPAIIVFFLARLANRAALPGRWVGMAAVMLALFVGMIKSGFPDPTLSPRRHDGGRLEADARLITVGLPLFAPSSATPGKLVEAFWNWYTRDLQQIGQSLVPLIVALGCWFRAWQLSRRAAGFAIAAC